jgi:hypothetical protein
MASEKDAKGLTVARDFCHICRYALVDIVDPAQHGVIDPWPWLRRATRWG